MPNCLWSSAIPGCFWQPPSPPSSLGSRTLFWMWVFPATENTLSDLELAARTGKTTLVFKIFLAVINYFWKPCLLLVQWFHKRWPIFRTIRNGRLGMWVRSAVAWCVWKSEKMAGCISSLQELLGKLTNDKCTFDKPTFISIYFYVCAWWWCSWIL